MAFPFKLIDLTQTISVQSPHWEGCGFHHKTVLSYADCASSVKFCVQHLDMPAGMGTHIDAPAHCIEGGHYVDDIPLENLLCPCYVLDFSVACREDLVIRAHDIQELEKRYGQILPQSFVLIYTGWGQFWHDGPKYINAYKFPSLNESAAHLLIQREVRGMGIDTLSPDVPTSGFPVHQLLLSQGKYIVENVARREEMPATGGYVMVLPLKLSQATESPVRLVGLVNR